MRWNNFLGPLLWCIIMSEFHLSSQPSLARLPWQQSNHAQLNVGVYMCVCVWVWLNCVCVQEWGKACRGNLLISWPISIYMKTNYSSDWEKRLVPEQKIKKQKPCRETYHSKTAESEDERWRWCVLWSGKPQRKTPSCWERFEKVTFIMILPYLVRSF